MRSDGTTIRSFTTRWYNCANFEIDQDIKSLANSKKINSKSEDILIKKLEENLSLAFMSVDQQESKVISFEQLGRVLFLMGLFEVIKYDEECQVVTEDFYTAERDDQIRRYDEVNLALL